MIWTADLEGHTTYVSPSVYQLRGYTVEEAMQQSFMEALTPDSGQIILQAFQSFWEKGAIPSNFLELEQPCKDGSTVWTEVNFNILPDKDGNPQSIIGVSRNITKRKKAENALIESEKRSKAIVEYAPIGIATSGVDKCFLSANESFCKILGYTEEELQKLTFKDITHPKDINESLLKICELEKGRIPSFSLEKQYVRKDGTVINGKIMISSVLDQNGKPNVFVAELEDITERKKADQKTMEEAVLRNTLLDNIPCTALVLEKKTHKIVASNKIARESGAVPGELCYKICANRTVPCTFCLAPKLWATNETQTLEVEYEGKHYRGIWLPYTEDLYVHYIFDITDAKKAEETRKVLENRVKQYSKHLKHMVDLRTAQLKDANERLVKSERLAAIGELAAMIGHDLRNPLAGIKNATYILKKKGRTISEAQAKETLEIIDKAIDHSNKIINDLLDYSREMKLKLIKYAAHPLIDEAVRMIQVPDRIQIVNHVDEEVCIWVDADKMIRVFINLIRNAIDAMPEKGTIEITSCQRNNFVEIAFADTGKGIPAEVLPKLFTPLFTTKAQGMGFGLAICKRIIEVQRGTIKVETAKDKGTTFTINLPAKLSLT